MMRAVPLSRAHAVSVVIAAAAALLLAVALPTMCADDVLGRPPQSNRKILFGYYEAYINETGAYSTIYQANSLADALAAWNLARVPSILLVSDAFLRYTPTRLVLRDDWQVQWQALAAQAEPFLQNGTITSFNLGDELVWNCLAPSNLTIMADAVRARFPRGSAIIWYNEATPPIAQAIDACGHSVPDYTIPASLDWYSTDIYHMDGAVDGWVNQWVRSFYEQKIYPRLPPGVQVLLVPGAFGSNVNHYPNGTYVCDKQCYDAMCAKDAVDFVAWAQEDTRVVGIFPWNWGGCAECNGSQWTPPHTCCMDELGARVQPQTSATWERLAKQLMLW